MVREALQTTSVVLLANVPCKEAGTVVGCSMQFAAQHHAVWWCNGVTLHEYLAKADLWHQTKKHAHLLQMQACTKCVAVLCLAAAAARREEMRYKQTCAELLERPLYQCTMFLVCVHRRKGVLSWSRARARTLQGQLACRLLQPLM